MRLSPAAEADLSEAVRHREQVAGSRSAATLLAAVERALDLLDRNPMIGSVRRELADPPVRFQLVWPYWIVDDHDERVVLRVIDARRDVGRVLADDEP